MKTSSLNRFLTEAGIEKGSHLILHASFRNLKNNIQLNYPLEFIETLKNHVTKRGSIIVPGFTYCFARTTVQNVLFRRELKPVTGALSVAVAGDLEFIRTSSPTHSFYIWGSILHRVKFDNNPLSPLGKGSVLEHLSKENNSFAFLAGVNFSSFTFLHYLESYFQVPYLKFNPWKKMGVINQSLYLSGFQPVIEIPGCAKSFTTFENYLLESGLIVKQKMGDSFCYLINLKKLTQNAKDFYKNDFLKLLCPADSHCVCCTARRDFLNEINF
ncbi:MAG: AAC(3) family N-acetyltransferase [Ignavibacteriaceae bacterium]|nr:AAC(3) family N-acetyltransferase [Ignavibacteriaceae bacterium]